MILQKEGKGNGEESREKGGLDEGKGGDRKQQAEEGKGQ